jgi:hypothetical protein
MVIIPDVIDSFIKSIDFSTNVTAYNVNGGNCIVTVSNILYARVGLTGYLNGEAFTITGVNYTNCTITFDGCPTTEPSVFSMDTPKYFHGTLYKINEQLSRIKNDSDKLPMSILFEVVRESLQGLESDIETIPTLNLAFLDRCDFKNWNTDQHYEYVIYAMRNLLQIFVDNAVNESISPFGNVTTIAPNVENHANFGIFQQNKGHVNSLLNEHLSGCTLSGDFPIRRCCKDK